MIYIIGAGPGVKEYMTIKSLKIIERADIIAGSSRFVEMFRNKEKLVYNKHTQKFLKDIELAEKNGKTIAVLVSGDPGISSLSGKIIQYFGIEKCIIIPGISSVQLAFARISKEWSNTAIIDLHAVKNISDKDTEILRNSKKIVVLIDNTWISKLDVILNIIPVDRKVFLMSDLGLENEKIILITEKSKNIKFGRLNLLLIIG